MGISLRELAAAFSDSDMRQGYADLRQEKIVFMSQDMGEDEMLEHVFSVEEDWDNCVMLPNLYDEYKSCAMESFARSRRGEEGSELLEALSGSGAGGRFIRKLKKLGLMEKWMEFLPEYFVEPARDWCEENGIGYEE